ncbi:MAG: hypothetical protein RLZZ292_3513, partial [Bacteroidota bacterium]
IPSWWDRKETGSYYLIAGTLPAVDGIENAIAIKCFDKKEFNTIKEFKNYIIEDAVPGKSPHWTNEQIFMGKKNLGLYKNIGEAYKVYMLWEGLMYHCQYVLLETKTAYLWINYTATETTFDKNKAKFDELLDGLSVHK